MHYADQQFPPQRIVGPSCRLSATPCPMADDCSSKPKWFPSTIPTAASILVSFPVSTWSFPFPIPVLAWNPTFAIASSSRFLPRRSREREPAWVLPLPTVSSNSMVASSMFTASPVTAHCFAFICPLWNVVWSQHPQLPRLPLSHLLSTERKPF